MRDIRPDIAERLQTVAKERERIEEHLKDLQTEERALEHFLSLENSRWHKQQPPLFSGEETASPTTAFLLDILSDQKDWSLGDLKRAASSRGVLAGKGSASTGRVLHGALISLKRRGSVDMVKSGVWRLAKTADSVDRSQLVEDGKPRDVSIREPRVRTP